ncbi:MAG: phosphoric monoester hydrolase [Roseibium sp.]|nr:phosphoric monoester hydrolase [Roseibium sp.]
MSWYEDYVLSNARTFVANGIGAIKLQDETVEPQDAAPRTIARMSALGTALLREFPKLDLGIIVQAHDPAAAIAIADGCGAGFVRLKVFTGAAVNAEGTRTALGPSAVAYRDGIGRTDIRIFADVHDRTAVPLAPVPNDVAAQWAAKLGADALVITGAGFEDTLKRIESARARGIRAPILIGGSVTRSNVRQALTAAEGVIVSSSLRREGAAPDAMDRWDPARIRALMDEVAA